MTSTEQSAVVDALAVQHPLFARATVERWVAEEAARYEGAPIDMYVPLLVQRAVDAALRELSIETASGRSITLADRIVDLAAAESLTQAR